MSAQSDLPIAAARSRSCTPGDVELLLRVLSGAGWCTSDLLHAYDRRLTPRRVRAIAEASGGHILGDPARGYRLTVEATPDEIAHAIRGLRSRARKLLARSIAISRLAHARIGR